MFKQLIFEELIFEEPIFEHPIFEQPILEQSIFEQSIFEEPFFNSLSRRTPPHHMRWMEGQGYLAHKKPLLPLGPP
jgi:hypothetical protein